MKLLTLFPVAVILMAACSGPKQPEGPSATVLTNATLFDGTGAGPITDAVVIIQNGRIKAVGTVESTAIPDNANVIDCKGKFIIPGLINAHGHVGEVKGIEAGHYSTDNVIDNLAIYARYGITTVVSLGGDKKDAEPVRAVNDTTSTNHTRLYIAGDVINGNTPAEAAAGADSNHAMGVDWMKIRVDDNLGSSPKMSEEVYKAVITRSHELGYKIATHMYYLDDAKKLLAAGSDMMAHSVRDKPVDEEFIKLMKDRNVCYCPTLTRELSTYVYGDTADFFNDPFFIKEYDSALIQPLKDPKKQEQIRNSKSAKTYKQQLPVAMANLKTLSDQGIPIAFGTDSGVATRFFGYFEHVEMAMMAEAGLTPMQILVSATKTAADCMGLNGVGTLEAGKWADLVVLTSDPLKDIKNTRTIESVWIGGRQVPMKP
jgi:imidazolonepropionase-like amidohydrolase